MSKKTYLSVDPEITRATFQAFTSWSRTREDLIKQSGNADEVSKLYQTEPLKPATISSAEEYDLSASSTQPPDISFISRLDNAGVPKTKLNIIREARGILDKKSRGGLKALKVPLSKTLLPQIEDIYTTSLQPIAALRITAWREKRPTKSPERVFFDSGRENLSESTDFFLQQRDFSERVAKSEPFDVFSIPLFQIFQLEQGSCYSSPPTPQFRVLYPAASFQLFLGICAENISPMRMGKHALETHLTGLRDRVQLMNDLVMYTASQAGQKDKRIAAVSSDQTDVQKTNNETGIKVESLTQSQPQSQMHNLHGIDSLEENKRLDFPNTQSAVKTG